MREILFRGKRKDNGEWVEGYFVNCFDEFYRENGPFPEIIMADAERICAGEYTYDKAVEVIPETVGQWTGLLDKNGKKIFEGDVVEIDEHDACVNGLYQVIYDEKNHCYALERNVEHHYNHFSFSDLNGFNISCKVLGNIYDNPELMEAK